MRKEVIAPVLVFLMIIGFGVVYAQSATQEQYNTEIAEAFTCVDNNIRNAGTISLGEAVFGALADVKNEKINATIEAKRVGNDCYAETGTRCKIKDTAQVALAKMWIDKDVEKEINWLRNQTGAIQGLTWYLQITIENNRPGECVVKYKGQSNTIKVREDLKLEGNPGSCLEISNSDYWLKIKDSCIDETFEISCGNGNFTEFFTNLLYKKTGEETTFVSSTTNRKSANAWATEEITALCFKEGDCNYEASLWATFALYKAGEETKSYAPYLRALSSGANEKFFPSTFLFRIIEDTKLTDEQYTKVLSEQRPGGLFRVGNTPYNEFYDSALAMMALGGSGQGADATELRESAVPGLFNEQGDDGCFGSPRDTAFILHASGWSRESLPQACAEEGKRTSIEEQICCSGLTKLPDKTMNASNNVCIEGVGYGYCTSKCGDGIKQSYENACSCPIDFAVSNTCVAGQWFTGNPIQAKNTSFEKGYCHIANETGGWENGCCVSGQECVGSGSNSICEKIPDGDEQKTNECYQGSWYNASNSRISTTEKEGFCHLASGSSWPYGCCPQGYECNYDEGNETQSICEKRIGVGGGTPAQATDCSLSGYYCVADPFDCLADGGIRKRDLDCPGFDICCSIDVLTGETCTDKGGIVCQEDEQCDGAIEFSTSGPCCTGGVCEEQADGSTGENDAGGSQGGTEIDGEESGNNFWWWVLFFGILIFLVILGIVYRDRLRVWMFKMKGKTNTSRVLPGVPPGGPVLRRAPPSFGFSRPPMTRPGMRPAGASFAGNIGSVRRKPTSEKEKEMDETLRKLKEMGG